MQRTSLSRTGVTALLLAILVASVMLYIGAVSSTEETMVFILGWTSLSFLAAGGFMLLRAPVEWLLKDTAAMHPLQMLPEDVLRNWMYLPRHRRVPLMLDLPNFGMYWGWILSLLMFVVMVGNAPRPQRGLMIRLPPLYATTGNSPESETLGIYVDGQRRFYVNGKVVAPENLASVLHEELGRRVVWTVYFEADDNCDFGDALYTIGTIQRLGARVYWITPRVRDALNRKLGP